MPLCQVLPEQYGRQAQLVSLAESVAARRAGEAAVAHEQATRQGAAQATVANGGPVTSRLPAAGSTDKRYNLMFYGMLHDCFSMSMSTNSVLLLSVGSAHLVCKSDGVGSSAVCGLQIISCSKLAASFAIGSSPSKAIHLYHGALVAHHARIFAQACLQLCHYACIT